MDHMMHVDQHHDSNLEEQCSNHQDAGRTSSASVSVSRVVFVLAAIAFLSLVSSSSFAFGASSTGATRTAATRQLLAALCGVVASKKALFIFSNVIFLFLAADCRCFFGICTVVAPSKSDDDHHTASELSPCAVQVAQPCASYSGYTTCASGNSPEEQEKRRDVPVSSAPESFRLEGDDAKNAALETVVVIKEEPACSGVPDQELEKLEIDELNRKFEEFIQSRRVKWIKEEEVLQCQQSNL